MGSIRMVEPHRPQGLYCAMLTPMRDDGSLDLDGASRLVDHLVHDGVDGLVVLGTTGELGDLTVAEQDKLARVVVAAADGRVPVVAGIGALGTSPAVDRAGTLADLGADGLLVLPALYWDGLSSEDVAEHLLAVGRATDLGIVAYDYPVAGRLPIDPGMLCDVAADEPRIVGVKQTVMDISLIERMSTIVRERGSDLVLGVGFEQMVVPSHALGGRLLISGLANFCAPLLRSLLAALRQADGARIAEDYASVLRLAELYRVMAPPIPALKAAAAGVGVPIGATARVGRAEGADHARVRHVLESAGLGVAAAVQ